MFIHNDVFALAEDGSIGMLKYYWYVRIGLIHLIVSEVKSIF
jgi:hypothetical protein